MADPLRPLNLTAGLAVLEAVLNVCCAIPGAATRAAGVPWVFPEVGADGQVVANGDSSESTGARLTYDVISITGLGQDELRSVYDPELVIPGDTYEPNPEAPEERLGGHVQNVSGNRLITVQVKCEVHTPDAGGPFTFLERARTRLGLPTVGDALEEAGLAINDILDSRPADFRNDSGHWVKAAYFELILNAADCATDDPITTIEQLEADEPEFT